MKKLFIKDIRAGDTLDDVFVLSEKTMAQKRDGNSFLNITLSDKTGNIKGVIWDRVDDISTGTASGNFVQIQGTVSEYKGMLQLVVKNMTTIPSDSINPSDFLPATRRDIDKMFLRLLKITASMEAEHLKKLFEAFFNDMNFVGKFKNAPAAKKMHHAYIGGLLEHTLSMALLADRIAGHYSGVDRDLLLAGAILHDIGKVREFNYKYSIDYSDEGRFLSHVVIGIMMLDEKIQELEDFPRNQAVLLRHMIISHHGTREFGSPEPPKTIEAVLLNYIDEVDAKVNGIRDFMATEDPNESWTSYHRLLGRHFYKGKGN